MRARHISAPVILSHFSKCFQQPVLQRRGVIYGKISIFIMDNAIRRPLPHRFVDEITIRCQLIDMGIIRCIGCFPRFHLYWDNFSVSLHKIIWLAGKTHLRIVKRLLHPPPFTSIRINDTSAWQTGLLPLPIRLPKEKDGDKEEDEREIKHFIDM